MDPRPFSQPSRLGPVLILAGIFLPAFFLFFVDNFHSKLSLAENIKRMSAPVTADTTSPQFEIADLHAPNKIYQMQNGVPVEYAPSVSDDEMIRAVTMADRSFAAPGEGKHWRFCGWKVEKEGMRIAFSSVLFLGLLAAFVGLLLLIVRWPRRSVPSQVHGQN